MIHKVSVWSWSPDSSLGPGLQLPVQWCKQETFPVVRTGSRCKHSTPVLLNYTSSTVHFYFLFKADISRADLVEEIRRRTCKPWSFSHGRHLILFSCKHKADSSSKQQQLDVRSSSASQSILKQLCCPVTKKVYLSICILIHHKKSVTFMLGLARIPVQK